MLHQHRYLISPMSLIPIGSKSRSSRRALRWHYDTIRRVGWTSRYVVEGHGRNAAAPLHLLRPGAERHLDVAAHPGRPERGSGAAVETYDAVLILLDEVALIKENDPGVLVRMVFKNCTEDVRKIIGIVVSNTCGET
jgi:hypothetical protein